MSVVGRGRKNQTEWMGPAGVLCSHGSCILRATLTKENASQGGGLETDSEAATDKKLEACKTLLRRFDSLPHI